ncbi:MAG: porin [Gammaproteobacteria bacterium]
MRKTLITTPLLGGALLTAGFGAHAEGLIESMTGTNFNDTQFLKDIGVEIGAWAATSITVASHNDNRNDPIAFADRNRELQFNQFNAYIERAVNTEGSEWDFGGRVDFMFGTDADNTQAAGWDNKLIETDGYYNVAFPQAYAEIYAPFGNGITAKIGHFYTIIGYEVVTAPDNFFYSHAYTMNYGEPFTHTGALFSYPINDNFSVTGGAVMGWDNFREEPGAWNFLGGVNWTSDDERSAVAVAVITGDQDESVSDNTTMYSIVISHDIADNLHYVFQHDLGVMEGGAPNGGDTDWYGINQYLTYDINEELSAGVRAEWFRDSDGSRTDFDGNFYAFTAGLNWSPTPWMKLRPEVRYDWADTTTDPFNGGTDDDQIAFSMDVIITF